MPLPTARTRTPLAAAAVAALAVAVAAAPVPRPGEPPAKGPAVAPLPAGCVARLGSPRFRHGAMVEHLAVSPDSKTVVTLGNGRLRVWDFATGRLRAEVSLVPSPFVASTVADTLLFTRDGRLLGTRESFSFSRANGDDLPTREVIEFDPATGEVVRAAPVRVPSGGPLVLGPDGKRIYITTEKGFVIADATTCEQVAKVSAGEDVVGLIVAADGKVVVGYTEKALHVYNADGKKVASHPLKDSVSQVELSADGRWLATTDGSKCVVRHTATGRVHLDLPAAAGPDGGLQLLFAAADRLVLFRRIEDQAEVWDVPGRKKLVTFDVPGGFNQTVPTADGKAVVVAGFDGAVVVYDLVTGRPRPQSADPPTSVVLSHFADDHTVVGLAGGSLAWDTRTGKQTAVGPAFGGMASYPTVSRDLKRVAVARKGTLTVYDAATNKELAAFKLPKEESYPVLIFRGEAGDQLIGVDEDRVHVWDVAAKSHREVLVGRGAEAGGVADLSWDGKWLAVPAAAGDGEGGRPVLRIFDADGLTERTRIPVGGQVWQFTFAPDGNRIVVVTQPGHDGHMPSEATVYDVATGAAVRRLRAGVVGYVNPVWSPDGRCVAFANPVADAVEVWEVASGRRRQAFSNPDADLSGGVAFSPDGGRIASAGLEFPVYLWDVHGDRAAPPPAPDAAGLEAAWRDLAADDAAVGFAAVRLLARHPHLSVPLLRDRLPPATPADPAHIRRRAAELDAADYRAREQAHADLLRLADRGRPLVREAWRSARSGESRRRLDDILAAEHRVTAAGLRAARAAEVLEGAATDEAKGLLRRWAAGAPGARLTEEAKEALARLSSTPRSREAELSARPGEALGSASRLTAAVPGGFQLIR